MSAPIDHDEARRCADGWASDLTPYPPIGKLARAYLDLLKRRGLLDEQPHTIHLREMRETTRGES